MKLDIWPKLKEDRFPKVKKKKSMIVWPETGHTQRTLCFFKHPVPRIQGEGEVAKETVQPAVTEWKDHCKTTNK